MLIAYLRELICYAHKDSPNWVKKNIIEQDIIELKNNEPQHMIIDCQIFNSETKKDDFSIINSLDLPALNKILCYRMENQIFPKEYIKNVLNPAISRYRNKAVGHKPQAFIPEIPYNLLGKVIKAIENIETDDLQIQHINSKYLNMLIEIYNICKSMLYGN